jgi:hypothetical protein
MDMSGVGTIDCRTTPHIHEGEPMKFRRRRCGRPQKFDALSYSGKRRFVLAIQ